MEQVIPSHSLKVISTCIHTLKSVQADMSPRRENINQKRSLIYSTALLLAVESPKI